jgi:hypothetical protein
MIFIAGDVPSSKNSRVKQFPSRAVGNYLRSFGIVSYSQKNKEIIYRKNRAQCNRFPVSELAGMCAGQSTPIIMGFHFVRRTKGRADFNNLTHILCDLFVAGGVIEDDDLAHFYPVPLPLMRHGTLCNYSVSKEHPGVFVDVGVRVIAEYPYKQG